MTFIENGLVQRFLDLLGIDIITATGGYIAVSLVSCILAISIVSLMLLIFRLIVYLKKG